MHKFDLVKAVADSSKLTRKQAAQAVEALLEGITQALKEGAEVQLVDFGGFKVAQRKERLGVRPGTTDPVLIEARKVVVFRPGKGLREAVK